MTVLESGHAPSVNWPMLEARLDAIRIEDGHWRDLMHEFHQMGRWLMEQGDPRSEDFAVAFSAYPDRIEELCRGSSIGGDIAARMRRWSGVETEVEAEDRIKREIAARRERWKRAAQQVPYDQRDRRARRALKTDPGARFRIAQALQAKITRTQARLIVCPNCSRRSVWFWLEPGAKSGAECRHRGDSCGWFGSLWSLALASGEQS